ncbi:hypothetical protein GCM10010430_05680 [Kitasatospora cystarginea]|uniref:Uncharacterized protein n=1 Tax=Kitasatospora cystarginea TaxID=58350 RepID=A0ABP5Q8R7_9ACTN
MVVESRWVACWPETPEPPSMTGADLWAKPGINQPDAVAAPLTHSAVFPTLASDRLPSLPGAVPPGRGPTPLARSLLQEFSEAVQRTIGAVAVAGGREIEQ